MQKEKKYIKSRLKDNSVKTTLLTVFLFFLFLNSYSQILYSSYGRTEKPDYCSKDSLESKSIIGRQVKIWGTGGVYSSLNNAKGFKFPTKEIKRKSGTSGWGSYYPKAGDLGTIVSVFRHTTQKTTWIYLIQVDDNYVPIWCHYLTDIDLQDAEEEKTERIIQDSINNVLYANGCKFKSWNENGNRNWSRAGLFNIDKVSEIFACDLISEGIDTVLLCKYIFDNGSSPIEKAFVLWTDKGKGYLKSFFNNPKHIPTENKIVSFEAGSLINHFFENRIDTVTTKPTSDFRMSHDMGYSIQLFTPNSFYRERLRDYLIQQDKAHPKSVWWNLISENLENIEQE
jgi:hypothetical protein